MNWARKLADTFTIAIDGPAASGKGTLARKLAGHLGFHHLDSGLTYRGVAHALMEADLPLDNEDLAVIVAENLDLSRLDQAVLSAHDIGEAASKIAVMGRVRKVLVQGQREFAGKSPGTIIDGRDIGTVVCPDAPVKLFVTAEPEIRARRRFDEIIARGGKAIYEAVLDDIKKRDARDMARSDSPLRPADDAHLLDTSQMSIQTAFQVALDLVQEARGS